MNLLSACISGAATVDEVEAMLGAAGFVDIDIRPKEESREFIREWEPGTSLEDYVLSASIQAAAVKPPRVAAGVVGERSVLPSIAVISDIHGNRLALEAVLDDIRGRGIETTYCLGDLVGYGPDPNGVIDLIRDVKASLPSPATTTTAWAGSGGTAAASTPTRRPSGWATRRTLSRCARSRPTARPSCGSLPGERRVTRRRRALHLVHGSPRKINEYLLRDRDERTFLRLAESETDDVLVFGHTHDPWSRSVRGRAVRQRRIGGPPQGR